MYTQETITSIKVMNILITLKCFLMPPQCTTLTPVPRQSLICSLSQWVSLHFFKCSINEIRKHEFFFLASFLSRFIHIVAYVTSSFFKIADTLWMYHNLFTYCWTFDCFQFEVITNEVVVNIHCTSLCMDLCCYFS